MSECSQADVIIGELTGKNLQKSHVTYKIVGCDNFVIFDFVLRHIKPPENVHSPTVADHHKNVEELSGQAVYRLPTCYLVTLGRSVTM